MSHNGTGLPPIFLFGFERSGTTLLSMMVGAHPEIAVPLSTTGLWYRYGESIEVRYNALRERGDLERLVDDLLAEERIRLWDASFTRDEVLDVIERPDFPAVVEAFHSLYAWKTGKVRWGNMDIATLREMDCANAWFPNARFLHIVRDGRDVALSHLTMPYGASNVGECAEQWRHDLLVNAKMGAMLPPERYMIVRYEDLVLDTKATLSRMCDFMSLSYSERMLTYTDAVEGKIPEDRRWLWPAIDKPPDASKVFGWRRSMSTTARTVFEWAAGDVLKRFSYEAYDVPPKAPAGYLLEVWYLLGKGHRFQRLAKRLGLKRKSRLEREAEGKASNA